MCKFGPRLEAQLLVSLKSRGLGLFSKLRIVHFVRRRKEGNEAGLDRWLSTSVSASASHSRNFVSVENWLLTFNVCTAGHAHLTFDVVGLQF